MKVYLVGGAVRDGLLGIANNNTERDWVVVGSNVAQMLDLGYRQVGKDFPVFLHPETYEEYALARLESKIASGYHGFEFNTDPTVTLEQDLSRRDLTINAMAQDGNNLIDPFNGKDDLDNGLLKHISNAFSEDPVRVLRVARFAARFQHFGFKVAHSTHKLMQKMVANGEVNALTPERVFKELNTALSYATPSAFFKVLSACGAYQKIFPMLANVKHKKHSKTFIYLDNLDTDKLEVKFAIWLKDEHADNIKALCKNIKCPKYYQQLALLSSEFQAFARDFVCQSAEALFDFFVKTDALRRQDRFADLLSIFTLLKIDISQIVRLRDLLSDIDVTELEQNNIGKALIARKRQIINLFLNPTK